MSASSTAQESQRQTSMLVQAAEAGDFAVVYALIAAGVDVNSANQHGTTALMAAASNGHLDLVSFLLESGADSKAKRFDGFDALALAGFYGHQEIRELLSSGADRKRNDCPGTAVTQQNERSSVPKALEVEKQSSSFASAYVPKPRYKRKSRKLVESSYIESTYVAKPRYRDKRKFQKLVRCLAYITSDWRRLTGVSLIVMFVCVLSVVAMLNLFGSSNLSQADAPVPIPAPSAADNSSFNPQNDLESSTQAEPIRTTSVISDAPPEPLPTSSKTVDGLHQKAAMTTRQETQGAARSAQSTSVKPESIPSKNVVAAPLSNKTQRPRRVTGKNDQLAPAATSGRNTKGKVIQWP